MNRECGVTKTIKVIAGKWTVTILYQLTLGKKRFGELEKAMVGISPKTLSLRLKMLEKQGIIIKKIFPEIPLHVEYYLTKRGIQLKKIFVAMEEWGKNL